VFVLGINDKSEVVADLQIGSTSKGNVRLYISGKDFSIPLDFNPDEADDIAAEIKDASKRARNKKKLGSK